MKTLSEARLYGIVDLGYIEASKGEFATEQLVAGGVDIIQIRAKGEPLHRVRELALSLHRITSRSGVPLIINDYPELLRDVPAEGAHVGQEDGSVENARHAAGRQVIIGKSTHSLAQAVSADAEGADYIGFGPLFATPTKPGRPPIGLENIAAVHNAVKIPIFCIGGIKHGNLSEVVAAGARRVVIVSGWLQAAAIAPAVRQTAALLPRR